ncbi:recombinase family protein [Metabacillus fastidiosus]|uniref:recombinase family protein n=1 Tax=Metabacillus fastidiosus TaxID=1458 RepID=UPI002E1CA2D8|nr:recombinase family protein [Metabacillus fastidiosus]
MTKIGYARVSTTGQSLDMQIDALEKAGCERIFEEKESGANDNRPQLANCLDYLRKGDILVVYKLDRLGRSTKKLIELSEELESKGIELLSIRDSIDTTTVVGKAMFKMLAVLSEMERDLIAERTRAGLEAARARGRQGGRPRMDQKKIDAAIALYETQKYTIREITEETGVSKAKLYQALKENKNQKS